MSNKDKDKLVLPPVDQKEVRHYFEEVVQHKPMLQTFKKYLQESNLRDVLNLILLRQDINAYQNSSSDNKDSQSSFIYKTYLEKNSRKHSNFPDRIKVKLTFDRERPKSATLRDIDSYSVLKLDEAFTEFLQQQAEYLGAELENLLSLSMPELMSKIETDATLLAWKKKGKITKQSGRAQPGKDDKIEFLLALNQSSSGPLPLQMLHFYKYLIKFSEVDQMPHTHRDLLFYLEVQRFKECSHAFSDEDMLKKKVQTIQDCFLESHIPPTLQIDVSSEIQQRSVRAAQKYVAGKDMTSTIFDEAQFTVLNELLPYWAGFRKWYSIPQTNEIPVTKIQKLIRKRLEDIENYKVPIPVLTLPAISTTAPTAAYSFSLKDGVKHKGAIDEASHDRESRMTNLDSQGERRMSRRISVASKAGFVPRNRRLSVVV